MTSAIARLTGAKVLVVAMAFATGPIQARALGPVGRGELAAILQPLQIITWLLDLGLTGFVTRERARGTHAGTLYGTVSVLGGAFSLLGVAAAIPLAHLFGHGRPTVVLFLEIGLYLSPLSVVIVTLGGAMSGESRWGVVSLLTILSPLFILLSLSALLATGQLTVATAATVNFAMGVVANIPVFVVVARAGRWRWESSLARRAVRFGVQNWMANISVLGNARLDQLLMAAISSSRQLGLYAVAASLSGVTSVLVESVSTVIIPRTAAGDPALVPRISRVSLLLVVVACAGLALVSPVMVPLVYGGGFRAAVPMLLILLLNPLPGTLMAILSSALTGFGRPAATLRPQAAGLLLGAPLLFLVLPILGGVGAAIVTDVSSVVTASLLLREAQKSFGGSLREYCVPSRADAVLVVRRLVRLVAR